MASLSGCSTVGAKKALLCDSWASSVGGSCVPCAVAWLPAKDDCVRRGKKHLTFGAVSVCVHAGTLLFRSRKTKVEKCCSPSIGTCTWLVWWPGVQGVTRRPSYSCRSHSVVSLMKMMRRLVVLYVCMCVLRSRPTSLSFFV